MEKVRYERFSDRAPRDFEPSMAHPGRLTISDIGIGESTNPQSLQGFFASLGLEPVRSVASQIG
jgi:hypothetical protein